MATETETHFVARVVFDKVVRSVTKATGHHDKDVIERDIFELGNYTFKDTDLENLKGRLNAVTSIVTDLK
jgi:hypothetical protein